MWKLSKKRFVDILKHYNIKELVEKTGFTRQTFYNWKNGYTKPSIDAILKICNTFDINPASFFDVDDIDRKQEPLQEKDTVKLDPKTQYIFKVANLNLFTIAVYNADFINIDVYKEDEDSLKGLRKKESIKIKIKNE